MAAVTICSDFGALKNYICHSFPIYLPWSNGTRWHDISFLNVESEKPTFSLSSFTFRRRQWHPTPVLLPGKSHGWWSLVGYSPRGHVGHNWVTSVSLFTFMHWRRKWQPTPVFLPGESQEWEPGGVLSMGSHRVGHDWSDLAAAAAFIFKRLFSSSSLSAIWVVSSAYLRLLIFLSTILIPACVSSSTAFLMMYSAYKLNKQGDNIQPWHTGTQSIVSCPVLTVASWPAYRFLKRQVRWFGMPISFRIFHSLLWSTQSKALV